MALPVVCYVAGSFAMLTLLMKNSLLDQIAADYVRTVIAKGATRRRAIWLHAFRNALIPIITASGSVLGIALCGAVITEQVFSIPGLGSLMVTAINSRDYPIVRGSVLLLAVSFSVVNLLIDLLYAVFDPRIRAQFSGKTKNKKLKVKPAAREEASNG